jgi:hypothetical protein
MNDSILNKIAVAFGLFSLALVFFGSLLNGARLSTSFIRGIESFLILGFLAWGVGKVIWVRFLNQTTPPEEAKPPKGEQINQSV